VFLTFIASRRKLFFSLLLLVTVLRNGFVPYMQRLKEFDQDNFTHFVCEYRDCGILFIADSLTLFGYRFGPVWFLILYLLILAVLVYAIYTSIKSENTISELKLTVVISVSPLFAVTFQRFGTYDALPLLASVLGIVSKSKVWLFLSTFLFVGTNPEGAFVAGVALVLLHIILIDRTKTEKFGIPPNSKLFGMLLSFLSLPALVYSFFDSTTGSALEAIVFVDSKKAMAQFISGGHFLVYSWLGSLWFLMYIVLSKVARSDAVKILSLIFLIGSITLFASDGTRNSALGLTALTFALLFSHHGKRSITPLPSKFFLVLLFLPSINVSNFNVVLPFYPVLYILGLARPILISV